MEDERVARTILSALLKVEVVKVEVRPHEYSDDNRDTLSVLSRCFSMQVSPLKKSPSPWAGTQIASNRR